MRVTWLGHGSFRIEVGGQVLLLDPWIKGNPAFPEERGDEVIAGATHILITHGHFDHTVNAVEIARRTGAPLIGMYEVINALTDGEEGIEGIGYNRGGTVMAGEVACTLVQASHSSTMNGPSGEIICTGQECGFMIAHGGRTLYAMGDTDIMADWEWMAELHRPDFAIVPIGGHFTMDGARASWGLKRYLPSLKSVIPGHYRTFPLLAQSADSLVEGMAPVPVHVLEVMGSVDL